MIRSFVRQDAAYSVTASASDGSSQTLERDGTLPLDLECSDLVRWCEVDGQQKRNQISCIEN